MTFHSAIPVLPLSLQCPPKRHFWPEQGLRDFTLWNMSQFCNEIQLIKMETQGPNSHKQRTTKTRTSQSGMSGPNVFLCTRMQPRSCYAPVLIMHCSAFCLDRASVLLFVEAKSSKSVWAIVSLCASHKSWHKFRRWASRGPQNIQGSMGVLAIVPHVPTDGSSTS